MKKLVLPMMFILLPALFSCSSAGKLGKYTLNEKDAAAAIRLLLQNGTNSNGLTGAFSKEMIMSTLFPEPLKKVLNTLNQLGLTSEIDRFTTTLSTAAQKTAAGSVPIFTGSINRMNIPDAMRIIRNGGTSATDYLKASVGDSIRRSITPVMKEALNEYKLYDQWNEIIKPVKGLAGNRLNLDLANIMAGAVSEAMFQKIAENEVQVRSNAAARTTPLLQKVFSRSWN